MSDTTRGEARRYIAARTLRNRHYKEALAALPIKAPRDRTLEQIEAQVRAQAEREARKALVENCKCTCHGAGPGVQAHNPHRGSRCECRTAPLNGASK